MAPKKKPGPKGGPTPEQRERLLIAAERGATNRDAAAILGISETTLYNWIASENYGDFGEAYTRAKATGRFRIVNLIADQVAEDWRAGAWLLERMDPAHWGKTELDGDSATQKIAAFLRSKKDTAER